jgi:hypothetical protein
VLKSLHRVYTGVPIPSGRTNTTMKRGRSRAKDAAPRREITEADIYDALKKDFGEDVAKGFTIERIDKKKA